MKIITKATDTTLHVLNELKTAGVRVVLFFNTGDGAITHTRKADKILSIDNGKVTVGATESGIEWTTTAPIGRINKVEAY